MSCLIRGVHTRTILLLLYNTTEKLLLHRPPILPIAAVTNPNLQITRYKSKGGKSNVPKRASESETEENQSDEDILDNIKDKHTKTLNIHVPSMRLDTLLKAGLGLSRNKIEVLFYESKIRVNGEKILKKSLSVNEGDEIDVVKGVPPTNPDFLTVARVEVLSAKGEDDTITVKIRRCKSLLIENYDGRNKWSHST